MNSKLTKSDKLNIALFLLLAFIAFIKILIPINAYASGNWKGYAVYRDGAFFNVNDHAAIMNKDTKSESSPVVHSPGPFQTVQYGSWSDFINGNNFICICRPNNCTMSSYQDVFASKARELMGISYTVFDQIDYDAGSAYWVLPENITDLRCDGVVEFTYEWYGKRVGGSDSYWDITRNTSSHKSEHGGLNITPRKQNDNLLTFVTYNEPT